MLSDISMFITHLHNVMQTRNVNNDVILFGAGTGGTLAAWARKKFPHLVDFAWSSSGIFEVALSSFRNEIFLSVIFFLYIFFYVFRSSGHVGICYCVC